MMKQSLSFFFAALLCIIFPHALEAQCSASGNQTCATFFNRTCFAEDICAACLDGYIAFENRTESCFAIDDIDWETFIEIFNTTYKEDDLTREERLQLLIAIAKFISEHNAANPDFELEVNRYSADSPGDAQDRTGYVYIEGSEDDLEDDFAAQVSTTSDTLPARVNWVEQGAVTSVKDQGRCGCCWAISLAGAIESATAINANFTYLQSMSFQQFISCDPTNYGCDGGNIVTGMVYALRNQKGGMASLNDYPFTDEEGYTTEECQDKPVAVDPDDGKIVTTISDGRSFIERFARMKYAVSLQPVSMVLMTQCDLFSSYKSGVMTDDGDCRCEDVSCLDHAVLLVGYDDTYDPPYWLLKNSWGTSWGEEGYFRIAQASYERDWGLFGMLAQGVIPLNAQNLTGQVEDNPQTSGLTWWEILLIAIAGVLVVLGCCCVASMCFRNTK